MSDPRPIPWSKIRSWICDACGECCKWFNIPLTAYEYAKFSREFGFSIIEFRKGRSWLKKKSDKRCVFMIPYGRRWLCGVQDDKPLACQIWPFRVLNRPMYGRKQEAKYECEEWKGYVYVDPRCPKLIYGKPTVNFTNKIVKEFIQIALWRMEHQKYSTASLISSVIFNQVRTYQI